MSTAEERGKKKRSSEWGGRSSFIGVVKAWVYQKSSQPGPSQRGVLSTFGTRKAKRGD